MPLPRRVLGAGEDAEPLGSEQDTFLPGGQRDAGEGPGTHAGVWQSRT